MSNNTPIRRWALAAALAFLCLAGCDQPTNVVTNSPPRPVTNIAAMLLEISPPVPLNWDERPGPDGVQARLYFFGRGDLPVTVSGGLDVMLYEQNPQRSIPEAISDKPFKTWTYTGADLNRALIRTRIGWGYVLQLGWGADVPQTPKIVLRARYRSPEGPMLLSDPVTIQMVAN